MIEKGVPFKLQSEIPWHRDSETPKYNPLEKLPILIFDDRRPAIYESWFIQEYITQKYKGTGPDLVPKDVDGQLLAKQIQVVADGACDALGLLFFEAGRGEKKSDEWFGRQMRKVEGVLRAMDELVKNSKGGFLVEGEFSIADIAAGAWLGMMNMVETEFGMVVWKEQYPELEKYWQMLEARESFKETQPYMFELTEKVA